MTKTLNQLLCTKGVIIPPSQGLNLWNLQDLVAEGLAIITSIHIISSLGGYPMVNLGMRLGLGQGIIFIREIFLVMRGPERVLP